MLIGEMSQPVLVSVLIFTCRHSVCGVESLRCNVAASCSSLHRVASNSKMNNTLHSEH